MFVNIALMPTYFIGREINSSGSPTSRQITSPNWAVNSLANKKIASKEGFDFTRQALSEILQFFIRPPF